MASIKRRMRAAHLGRVNVGEAVRAQLVVSLRHKSRPGITMRGSFVSRTWRM